MARRAEDLGSMRRVIARRAKDFELTVNRQSDYRRRGCVEQSRFKNSLLFIVIFEL